MKRCEEVLNALITPENLTTEKERLLQEMRENKERLNTINVGVALFWLCVLFDISQRDCKEINTQVMGFDAQIKQFDAQIEQETRKLEAQTQKDHHALQAKLANAQAFIDGLEARKDTSSIETKRIAVEADHAKADGVVLERKMAEYRDQITQVNALIETARRHEKDALVPYGHDMKQFLETVSRMRWHGDMPLGPLGMFVKAKDADKWGPLLRNQLSQLLCAFAITDPRDRPALQNLIKETGK